MRRQDRMEQLKANGVDTSKYFQFTLDENTLSRGVALKLDGNNLTVQLADEVEGLKREIQNNGTVACTQLYRRWICAQMLRIQRDIENHRLWDIETYMRRFKYNYMRDVIMDELDALIAIKRDGDMETYKERSSFFTTYVILRVYETWAKDLDKSLANAKVHIQNRYSYYASNKGKEEYVKIGARNFYVRDVKNTSYYVGLGLESIRRDQSIENIRRCCKCMNELLNKYATGKDQPFSVPKEFMTAYKASGAYYTLKNLVLFHNAWLENYESGEILQGREAFEYLRTYLPDAYAGDGYKIYALMKRCLKDNDIKLNRLF